VASRAKRNKRLRSPVFTFADAVRHVRFTPAGSSGHAALKSLAEVYGQRGSDRPLVAIAASLAMTHQRGSAQSRVPGELFRSACATDSLFTLGGRRPAE
jgi:hypothetical protein